MILDPHRVDYALFDDPQLKSHTFRKGETILREAANVLAQEMFFVKSGSVAITVNDKPLETVPRGGIFGEMALIDRSPRSATVTAIEDTTVVLIDERVFLVLVQAMPLFSLDVMHILAERLRLMNAGLEQA